jgi:ABC-2 type transport system ATP-binding protein
VLVVDEPMVGLDPRGVRLVKDIFRELRDKDGTTVLLSTHTMHVAEELCDRISVIHRGRIVSSGTLADLNQATGTTKANLEEIFLALTRESQGEGLVETP